MKILIIYHLKTLKENGSNGFLVGSKLSMADVGLFEVILTVEELMGIQELNDYPNIQVILFKNYFFI